MREAMMAAPLIHNPLAKPIAIRNVHCQLSVQRLKQIPRHLRS